MDRTDTPIYFDTAATTQVDPDVVAVIVEALAAKHLIANPASAHGFGQQASLAVAQARAAVAAELGCVAEIVFTSGATESIDLALQVDYPGAYRSGGVGVMAGETLIHMAPPANRVPLLMRDLLRWLGQSADHALISSCVFHYELEFIHPFADGNGRMGRLWQTLILSRWRGLFADLPIESLVHANQDAYYQAIADSTEAGSATPFIEFMLGVIRMALAELEFA